MKSILHFALVLLLVVAFTSCGGDSFKIDGQLEGLGGPEVRVMFKGDSSTVDMSIPTEKDGHFTLTGCSTRPTLVNICDRQGNPIVMVVATNGDHLKVKGDASKPMAVKVKGNRLNEDWQLFKDEHKAFYTDPNPSRLNAAIEKYVAEHTDDMLSTVLLLADYGDYSDRDKVDAMLKSIEVQARPESLTQPFARKNKSPMPRMMSLTLIKHGEGRFEEVKLTGHTSLVCLWAQPQANRANWAGRLQLDSRIHIVDILTESDTMQWHKTIAGESWPHYWAPGGPVEQGIQLLGVTSLPWYAVTDSTGLVIYSGPNMDNARQKALDQIK